MEKNNETISKPKKKKKSWERLRILKSVLAITRAGRILEAFVIFVFAASFVFWAVEPGINSYGDALWYSYVNLFTIGFGDIVPQSIVGRILSVCLTIYATIVIAVLTGIIVTFYNLMVSKRYEKVKKEKLQGYGEEGEHKDDVVNLFTKRADKIIEETDERIKVKMEKKKYK